MRTAVRSSIAVLVMLFVAFPVYAGLDDSWDWPDDPATGKPRREIRIKYDFPADAKLGDKPLKDVMDEAVANWNSVKDDTGWSFKVVGASEEADVTIQTDDGLNRDGGAATSFRTDKDGRVVPGSAKIRFDPSPPKYDWDKAGKNKDDTKNPVSCAKHELSHLLRLDHQGGTRSISKKLKDPQGADTKDDDVTTVSADDKTEAKKTSTLAISKAEEQQPTGHDMDLRVPSLAGEMPAYPTVPEIILWAPNGAFLSPVLVGLQRRNFNSLPDPFLTESGLPGRLIKGADIWLEPLTPMAPQMNAGTQCILTIPYEDGLPGYDHLMEGGDPDYGPVEEYGLHPVLYDARIGRWLDVDLSLVGGGFGVDAGTNTATIIVPVEILSLDLSGGTTPARLTVGLAAGYTPFGDAMRILPDPLRGGSWGRVIITTALPAPPGGRDITVECSDPIVSPPGAVWIPEGETRAEAWFWAGLPPSPIRPLMTASDPPYFVESFFDVFVDVQIEPVSTSGPIGGTALLQATLRSFGDGSVIPGQPMYFVVDGQYAGMAFTDPDGVARLEVPIPEGYGAGLRWWRAFFFGVMPRFGPDESWGELYVEQAPTGLSTIDRTGTITEPITLRAYLRRLTDGTWLPGRNVDFAVEGTYVGTGMTNASGRADLNWIIIDGPPSRPIQADFLGDAGHTASSGTATLTALSWTTRMATFDRTQRITLRTELKCRLLRSDNVPLYNKTINFYIDGTYIITRPTDVQGYAKYPYYDVPDGAGAGTRTILSEWPGNGGYAAISKTATLTVLKALPYIWVAPKSAPAGGGGVIKLYAYFRRLYDYQKQENKPVTFLVDGTWVADVYTGSGAVDPGVARHLFSTAGLGVGTHTIRCEFAGDPWVEAGYGEGTLTIY